MSGNLKYRGVFLLVLLCGVFTSYGQSITAAEYFMNSDPGVGNGTPISITGDSVINASFSIPVSHLTAGFYQLYIRVKDQNNQWSIAEQKSFYVDTSLRSLPVAITAAEYFVDTDPGLGKGISMAIQDGDSLNTVFSVAPTGLPVGFHQLYLRIKDQNNQWSIAEQKAFYIDAALTAGIPPIVAAEYFIDKDSGAGNNTPVRLLPGNIVDTSFDYIAAGLPLGKHTVNLRVKDSAGNWSFLQSKNFSVCDTYGPLVGFDFAVSDTNVSFVNSSLYASGYYWNFGNGDTSSLANPLHAFKPGTYNTCLISRNDCLPGGDTLCKVVTVRGIAGINTNTGGNTGQVSVSITGGGFVPGMQFFLQENGQKIYGDTLIVLSGGLMTTALDLAGKPAGACDVIAVFPDGKSDTLYNGFTITGGTIPDLWVNMTGDNGVRPGFNQIYTITYGNRGNTDAIFVPMLISGLPLGTDIEVLRPIFRIDAIPGYESLSAYEDTMRRTIDDSDRNESFRFFYLRIIPAGSSGTLQVIFHVPGNYPAHYPFTIQIVLGQPLSDTTVHILPEAVRHGIVTDAVTPAGISLTPLGDTSESDGLDTKELAECVSDILGQVANRLGLVNLYKCIIQTGGFLSTASQFFVKEKPKGSTEKILDWTDLSLGLEHLFKPCVGAIPEYQVIKAMLDLLSKEMEITNAVRHCGKVLVPVAKYLWHAFVRLVGDPNSKYGVGDSTESHYTKIRPLTYVINFENEANVNANVQTVIVTDTLNSAYVDYTTFGFNAVSIGDSIYSFDNPVRSFVHDFDFSRKYDVKVRVTATFDSIAGIVQWNFYSIDPLTNQQTSNALAGFLPPDVNSPEGDGYVSFTINPAAGIKNGDKICNKATIYFDTNSPIPTDCWVNVFDLVKPVSKMMPLPARESKDTFAVSWSGTDNLSGIGSYAIFVSINDSAFVPWIRYTDSTSALYPGSYHNKYAFYSIATDNAGNVESPKTLSEAITTVDSIAEPLPAGQIRIYPIPAKNMVNIVISSEDNDHATLSLFDVNGRMVNQVNRDLTPGANTIVMNSSVLASGAYFLKIQRTRSMDVKKVVIVR